MFLIQQNHFHTLDIHLKFVLEIFSIILVNSNFKENRH